MPNLLISPEDCVLLLVDLQPGLSFASSSMDRQLMRNNATAIARTASSFGVPIVASTSASKVFSGPMLADVKSAIGDAPVIERTSMNAWEDEHVRHAVEATARPVLLIAGLVTEACVSFSALSAHAAGLQVRVVADACAGVTLDGHQYGIRRMEQAGITITSWLQVLLEFQRDWTRHATYEAARSVVVDHGAAYGIGLAYARDMIHPA